MMLSVELSIFGNKTEDELAAEAKAKLRSIGTVKSTNCTTFNRPVHELQLGKVLADINVGITLNDILRHVALLWCQKGSKDLLEIRTHNRFTIPPLRKYF